MRIEPVLWCLLVASGLFAAVVYYWDWNYTVVLPFFVTLGFIFNVLFWPIALGAGLLISFYLARRLFKF